MGLKDVSLPVCHKSSVLLCDRLADRASSVSSGTRRLLLQSHIFLRCSSCVLKQRGRKRKSHWFGVLEQTYLSHVRLLVPVKFYGLRSRKKPPSTIMTQRITTTRTKMARWMDSTWRCFKSNPKLLYNDLE